MLCTSAGASALMTNFAGSSEHRTMSTRSPASSLVTAVTREPRMPMHVPCGSSRGSFDLTAILARMPGSRAAALISISPSSISGTSSSNSRTRKSGAIARQDELRALRRAVDLHHVGAHAVAHAQHLLLDQLVARDHALDAAGLDDHVAALDALDRAGQQVVLALEEVVQDLLALGVADLLQDHLLRGLRADAAELDRLERLLDDVAELERRVALERRR